LFFLILVFVLSSSCNAGDWKSSLDFHLDLREFNYPRFFHRGLCDYEVGITQERLPRRHETSGINPHSDEAVYTDNVGNALFWDESLYGYDSPPRPPTNKENLALASLQVTMKNPDGSHDVRLAHIFNSSRHPIDRHFFSYGLSHDVRNHFELKVKNKTVVALPNNLDFWQLYHSTPHSEDGIFYEIGGVYAYKGYTKHGYAHYIDEILGKGSRGAILGVVLHIHTRFDMCGTCAYSLSWELNSPLGFGNGIFAYCSELNKGIPKSQPISFSALVSSRQSHLVWGPDRRTLPSGCPLPDVTIPSEDLWGEYTRKIDFSEDLSKKRRFAQSATPPFFPVPPPAVSSSPLYDFAIGLSNAFRINLPKV